MQPSPSLPERNSFAAIRSEALQLHSRPISTSSPRPLSIEHLTLIPPSQFRFVCYYCVFQRDSCGLAGSVLSTPNFKSNKRRPFLSIFGFIDSSFIERAIDSTATSIRSTTRVPSPLCWHLAKSIPRWTVQTSSWNARARKSSLVSPLGKGVSIIMFMASIFHERKFSLRFVVYCLNGSPFCLSRRSSPFSACNANWPSHRNFRISCPSFLSTLLRFLTPAVSLPLLVFTSCYPPHHCLLIHSFSHFQYSSQRPSC